MYQVIFVVRSYDMCLDMRYSIFGMRLFRDFCICSLDLICFFFISEVFFLVFFQKYFCKIFINVDFVNNYIIFLE